MVKDESKKKRLEGMLRAIQDIKSANDGLIGTQEVWEALRSQQGVYEAPVLIADRINTEVQKTFPELTYRATPERLTGLCNKLVMLDTGELVDDIPEADVIAQSGAMRFGFDQVYINVDEESEFERAKNYFLPFFLEANLERIASDDEIGSVVIDVLKRDYDAIRGRIEERVRDRYDEYVKSIIEELSVVNWSEEMSHKSLVRSESEYVKAIFDYTLNFMDMVERVQRDRMEHRLEYRRLILSHVLSRDTLVEMFSRGSIPKTWESLVNEYNMFILDSRERLRDLRKMERGEYVPEDSIAKQEYENRVVIERKEGLEHTLDIEIKEAEKTLNWQIFIRRLLGQEKNWINKVLGD